jgi:hypothetical protein
MKTPRKEVIKTTPKNNSINNKVVKEKFVEWSLP